MDNSYCTGNLKHNFFSLEAIAARTPTCKCDNYWMSILSLQIEPLLNQLCFLENNNYTCNDSKKEKVQDKRCTSETIEFIL